MTDKECQLDVSAYMSNHPSVPVADVINSAAIHLQNTLDPNEKLLVALLQNNILLQEHVESIQARPTNSQKNDELLSVLKRRGLRHLLAFINLLGSHGQCEARTVLLSSLNHEAASRINDTVHRLKGHLSQAQNISRVGRWQITRDMLNKKRGQDVRDESGSELSCCIVCMENKRKTVFVPCGHFVCCFQCAWHIIAKDDKTCVRCRCPLEDVIECFT